MTKKLERLLARYRKANRARLTAYARRSRALSGVCVPDGQDSSGWQKWKRVFKVPVTDELKAKLDSDIEAARLHKLKMSAELRAYCKKKKYHIQWDSSNQIRAVLTHLEWQLRTHRYKHNGDTLLKVMYELNLTKSLHYCF